MGTGQRWCVWLETEATRDVSVFDHCLWRTSQSRESVELLTADSAKINELVLRFSWTRLHFRLSSAPNVFESFSFTFVAEESKYRIQFAKPNHVCKGLIFPPWRPLSNSSHYSGGRLFAHLSSASISSSFIIGDQAHISPMYSSALSSIPSGLMGHHAFPTCRTSRFGMLWIIFSLSILEKTPFFPNFL